MQIVPETAEFIGKYFNDGVVPQVEETRTFFIFGEDDTPNKILSLDEFSITYDFFAVPHCALFKLK